MPPSAGHEGHLLWQQRAQITEQQHKGFAQLVTAKALPHGRSQGLQCCPLQGVKDISFSNDGRKFLSSSYDKVVKLWDTETGKVLRSFGEGKMFFTAR